MNGKRNPHGPWMIMYNVGSRDYFLQNNGKWADTYHSTGTKAKETKFWDYPGNAYNKIAKIIKANPELGKKLRVVNHNGIRPEAYKVA